jgi:hypothetical protein
MTQNTRGWKARVKNKWFFDECSVSFREEIFENILCFAIVVFWWWKKRKLSWECGFWMFWRKFVEIFFFVEEVGIIVVIRCVWVLEMDESMIMLRGRGLNKFFESIFGYRLILGNFEIYTLR